MEPTRLTLVRHGRSRADDERVHEGRYDSPLTEVGRRQAETRAEQWRRTGLGFDRLLASPLARASETAAILGATLGLEVSLAPAWLERDNGVLAGMDFELAQETYPERSSTGPFERKGIVGESNWTLQQRAAAAWSVDGGTMTTSAGSRRPPATLVPLGMTCQPFNAPAVMPRTNTPCTALKDSATGMVARMPPAISRFQYTTF